MSETAGLTREKILETAEDVLRRYGPAKATVVDVARALGVSHGSVYRHFASKADLRDTVVQIWLDRFLGPLAAIAAEDAPAAERLHRWLRQLTTAKQQRLLDDPELFAAYCELSTEAREVVSAYKDQLAQQVTRIIEDGTRQSEWRIANPAASAKAVLSAVTRFYSPAHTSEWSSPGINADFEEVWFLLLRGLQAF